MQGRNRERMSVGDFLDQPVLAALFGRLNEGFPDFGADPREVAGASSYESPWGTRHPKLQILTVAELQAGKGIDMPPSRDIRTFKKAPKAKSKTEDKQRKLIETEG